MIVHSEAYGLYTAVSSKILN